MKRKLFSLFVLMVSILFFQSCWDEHDVISISKDGKVLFETTITIKDDAGQFTFETAEKVSNELIGELNDNGWKTEKTWISKERPYTFTVSGSGNIREVGERTRFYELREIGDKEYAISFWGGEDSSIGNINRSIEINRTVFQKNAEFLDADGHDVSRIEKPTNDQIFTIKLG